MSDCFERASGSRIENDCKIACGDVVGYGELVYPAELALDRRVDLLLNGVELQLELLLRSVRNGDKLRGRGWIA